MPPSELPYHLLPDHHVVGLDAVGEQGLDFDECEDPGWASDGRATGGQHCQTAGFLEVTGAQPANGTRDVPADGKIVVSFNRPVVALGAREWACTAARHHPNRYGQG